MSVLRWTKKSLTYSLLALFVICGVVTFMYSQIQKDPPSVSVAAVSTVSAGSVSSVSSSVPRLTAPWMTFEELSALHLDAYYQIIIDNNIFRPLQMHSSVKVNPYQLVGTLVKGEGAPVAYILNTFTRRVYPVRKGDRLETFSVVSVTAKSASLRDKKGVITQLELGSMFLK